MSGFTEGFYNVTESIIFDVLCDIGEAKEELWSKVPCTSEKPLSKESALQHFMDRPGTIIKSFIWNPTNKCGYGRRLKGGKIRMSNTLATNGVELHIHAFH